MNLFSRQIRSTCPLPPQPNRMDLKVTAGEKDLHTDAG